MLICKGILQSICVQCEIFPVFVSLISMAHMASA